MGRKKKIIKNVLVDDFAAEGKCLVRHDGEVIFLTTPNIAPGDNVDIQVKRKRSNYSEAVVLRINSLSPMRVTPFCEHFGVCGGCKWQQIPYDIQLEQKQKQVTDQLLRLGKLSIEEQRPILPSEKTTFYRNKLEFTFSNARWFTAEEIATDEKLDKNALGFHVPKRFDKVIPIEKCYLQPDPSNQIRNFIGEYAKANNLVFYDHIAHKGFLRNLMIRTATTGQVLVLIQFADNDQAAINALLDALLERFPEISSLNYVINQKGNDSIYDLDVINYAGRPHIEEQMEGLVFRITPKSFYQTNPEQAERLYQITAEFADLKPTDILYDLYTGTGTIALYLARQVAKVIGVESVVEAIEDAKLNAKINKITNAVFVAGDMKKVLTDGFVAENGRPSVVVVDPPRAGMDKEVTEMLLGMAPERLVYVSCNAATQARDLAILAEKYRIEKIQPVDMFPQTYHVENVAKLTLK